MYKKPKVKGTVQTNLEGKVVYVNKPRTHKLVIQSVTGKNDYAYKAMHSRGLKANEIMDIIMEGLSKLDESKTKKIKFLMQE